jgi:hypothetical protein
MIAAAVTGVVNSGFFSVVKDLKHHSQKEKHTHCQYDYNKKMFCHDVYPFDAVAGCVRSAIAELISEN